MTFRNALAQSVNVPAVKALYLAGEKETIELARRMGLSTLEDWRRYGLTLVLGGGEVSLLEMTGAYATFAREGYRYRQTAIREVWDGSGKQIFTHVPQGEQVLDVEIARSITDVLTDNAARTPAFGSNSFLYFENRDVAAKTGTTNDYRDAWILGYTPTIAVGAWAGNNDNTAMEKKVAGFIIAPMWNAFLQEYFKKYPDVLEFTEPQPLDQDLQPILRGVIPGVATIGSSSREVSVPHSILHYINKDDPRGPAPLQPSNDSQYRNWEYGVLLWRIAQGSFGPLYKEEDENAPYSDSIEVTITEPESKTVFTANETVLIKYSIESEKPLLAVHAYFNKNRIGTKNTILGEFLFTPGELGVEKGDEVIEVVAYDTTGSRNRDTVRIVIEKP
jgi:membrane peptidoglycan carboxypeptidase